MSVGVAYRQWHILLGGPVEYDTLKSLQLKIIMSFLAGRDVFAIFHGKSLCYTLLPLLFDHLYRLQGDCCSCFLKEEKIPSRQSLLSCNWVASGIGHKLSSVSR